MFIALQNINQNNILPGFKGKFVHGSNITTAFWEIEKDAILPAHSHIQEQIAIVTEGKFELTVNGETNICEPGSIMVIPSNAIHSGRALTNCKITDIFAPVREDYKL